MMMSETIARPIVVLFLTSESVEDASAQNLVGFGDSSGAGTPHDWYPRYKPRKKSCTGRGRGQSAPGDGGRRNALEL